MSPTVIRYVAGRAVVGFGLLAMVSVVVYAGADLLPGDPATARLGGTATPQQIAQAQHRLGLDRPLPERYVDWVAGLLTGDLGTSASGRPVAEMISERLANSVLLTVATSVVLIPASLMLGVALGRRAGRRTAQAGSAALIAVVAVPEFVTASLLGLIFAVGLGWLPAVSLVPAGDSPMAHPEVIVLPMLGLLLPSVAYATRIIRASTAAALRSHHVEFMRLNGFAEAIIIRRAVLPAVLPAAAQVWLISGAALMGGAVLVERTYDYPGVGDVLVRAVQSGDLPVVQAIAVIMGTATVVAMIAADVLGKLLDPRRRA